MYFYTILFHFQHAPSLIWLFLIKLTVIQQFHYTLLHGCKFTHTSVQACDLSWSHGFLACMFYLCRVHVCTVIVWFSCMLIEHITLSLFKVLYTGHYPGSWKWNWRLGFWFCLIFLAFLVDWDVNQRLQSHSCMVEHASVCPSVFFITLTLLLS